MTGLLSIHLPTNIWNNEFVKKMGLFWLSFWRFQFIISQPSALVPWKGSSSEQQHTVQQDHSLTSWPEVTRRQATTLQHQGIPTVNARPSLGPLPKVYSISLQQQPNQVLNTWGLQETFLIQTVVKGTLTAKKKK